MFHPLREHRCPTSQLRCVRAEPNSLFRRSRSVFIKASELAVRNMDTACSSKCSPVMLAEIHSRCRSSEQWRSLLRPITEAREERDGTSWNTHRTALFRSPSDVAGRPPIPPRPANLSKTPSKSPFVRNGFLLPVQRPPRPPRPPIAPKPDLPPKPSHLCRFPVSAPTSPVTFGGPSVSIDQRPGRYVFPTPPSPPTSSLRPIGACVITVSNENEDEDERKENLYKTALEICQVEETFSKEAKHIGSDYVSFVERFLAENNRSVDGIEDKSHVIYKIADSLLAIRKAHSTLQGDLYRRLHKWNPCYPDIAACFDGKTDCLGECFNFLENKRRFQEELESAMNNSDFCQATKEFQKQFPNMPAVLKDLDFVHQNVMRYEILLSSYRKHLPPLSEEARRTDCVILDVRNVIVDLNRRMGLCEYKIRQAELAKRFNKEKFDPLLEGRTLVYDGEVTGSDRKRLYLILFTDFLLISKQAAHSKSKISDFQALPVGILHAIAEEHIERETYFQLRYSTNNNTINDIFNTKKKAERDKWVEMLNDVAESFSKSSAGDCDLDDATSFSSKTDSRAEAGDTLCVGDKRGTRTCLMEGCNTKFGAFAPRRECKQCGFIMCDKCTGIAPIESDSFKADRVCAECYDQIMQKFLRDDLFPPSMVDRSECVNSFSNDGTRILIDGRYLKWKNLFKAPPGGIRPKATIKALEQRCIVSGSVSMKGRIGMEKKRWGRLQRQLGDGGLILALYKTQLDKKPFKEIDLTGYSCSSKVVSEGGRLFELRCRNKDSVTFRVIHDRNSEMWDDVLSENLNPNQTIKDESSEEKTLRSERSLPDEMSSSAKDSSASEERLSHSQTSSDVSVFEQANLADESDSSDYDF